MIGSRIAALEAFARVAAEGSFTRAAAILGTSQPALSRTIRALEKELGLALLARTTRSVSPTAAGEQLLSELRPALARIDGGLAALDRLKSEPAGTIRLTMTRQAADATIRPVLRSFLSGHPRIQIEISVDDAFRDIISGKFDAGVRYGEHIDKDMVALRVGPDVRAAVVASPSYLARCATPSSPRDLIDHDCIGYRLPRGGNVYEWEFESNGRRQHVKAASRLILNDGDLIRDAALDGAGIAYLFEDQVAELIKTGRLTRVLETYSPLFAGYHLYYPDRKGASPALRAFIEALAGRERLPSNR